MRASRRSSNVPQPPHHHFRSESARSSFFQPQRAQPARHSVSPCGTNASASNPIGRYKRRMGCSSNTKSIPEVWVDCHGRRCRPAIPRTRNVVFLSVYGQDEVIARAFDMGATDYVVKPFSPTELSARIRAALRKRMGPDPSQPSASYAAAGLGIDYPVREVTVAGEPVDLTATEYAVLYELTVNAPRVVTHSVLLQRVWGPKGGRDLAATGRGEKAAP